MRWRLRLNPGAQLMKHLTNRSVTLTEDNGKDLLKSDITELSMDFQKLKIVKSLRAAHISKPGNIFRIRLQSSLKTIVR